MTLGHYMQALSAFHSVQGGMSMVISRWVELNTLFSVVKRLREFEAVLPAADPKARLETTRLMTQAQGRSPRNWWLQGGIKAKASTSKA